MRTSKNVDKMCWAVGDRIHKLRTREGLSQLRLAALLGLRTQNAVCNWECGKSYPCVRTIIKICQLFGVSADWLLFGKGANPDGINR